jgi:hypothetical protein
MIKVTADKTFLEGNLKGFIVDWYITISEQGRTPEHVIKTLSEMSDAGDLRDSITNNKFLLSNFKVEVIHG